MVCNLVSGQQTLDVFKCMCLTEVNDNSFSHYSLFVFVVQKCFSFTEAAVPIFNRCLINKCCLYF